MIEVYVLFANGNKFNIVHTIIIIIIIITIAIGCACAVDIEPRIGVCMYRIGQATSLMRIYAYIYIYTHHNNN